ncbi:MAG: hypothetical protein RL213_182 [Bacteroidota bacterium]|jgi:hypothetical protein
MKKEIKYLLSGAILTGTLFTFLSFRTVAPVNEYRYRQFSTVESIIPGGIGRSRMVSTDDSGTAVEKELMNFYSMVGINFGNIANNDKTIVDKINEYTRDGWELMSVTSGVQSPSEKGSQGIYMTRYLFRKPLN